MAPSEDVLQATREFLDEYPDAESALGSLVDRDEESSWTFDDVELDSGRFGELVSREIADKTESGAYTLLDREAVSAVLNGNTESVTADGSSSSVSLRTLVSNSIGSVDRREIGGVAAALTLVVLARLLSYGSVFREEYLVSPGNDPYFYRYWQAQLLEQSDGVTDVGLLAEMGDASRRPLTHALNWWFAELLGGTPAAADLVAAWLPIVGAVGTGIIVYLLAKLLTGDVRASIAAVAFLALAPVHIVYTQVGFLEHRLHQYFWLGVLALTVTWLAVDVHRRYDDHGDGESAVRGHLQSRSVWLVSGVLAVSVAASAHIWAGSALTFIPLAGYIALRVVVDVREDIPPLLANAPLIVGTAVGGVVSVGLYSVWGWSETALAVVPLLVAVGAVSVAGIGEVWRRQELQPRRLLAVQAVVAVGGLIVFRAVSPEAVERLRNRSEDLFFRESATETVSLFTTDLFVLLGPISQIGISFYLGLAVLGAATWVVSKRYEPEWLVVVCFSWYYMVLATFQARFAAQLTLFISVFAGVGCLYLLAKIELVRPIAVFSQDTDIDLKPSISVPRGQLALYLVGAIVLLVALNVIYAPSLVAQTTHSGEQLEAALTIEEHAIDTDRGYPDSAVEAHWGDIRMNNYFVNGEAERYDSNYERLLTADHPDDRHTGLREGGRYVVISEIPDSTASGYVTLFEGLGVGSGDVDETSGHFKPIYVGDDVRAFTVVEGAAIRVSDDSGSEVTASTTVTIGGEELSYERSAVVEDGAATIRVAHPGSYRVGSETVDVSEDAVYDGDEIVVGGS